jgi:hypothetical protein
MRMTTERCGAPRALEAGTSRGNPTSDGTGGTTVARAADTKESCPDCARDALSRGSAWTVWLHEKCRGD